jgi:hypothetical protein
MQSTPSAGAAPAAAAEPPASAGSPPGLLADALSLWRDSVGIASDGLQLIALETRQSGRSLSAMMGSGVMFGLLAVSAWLCLVGAMILWLIQSGLPGTLAMVLGALANLLLALGVFRSFQRHERGLGWPATLRALRSSAATDPLGSGAAAHPQADDASG